MPLSRPDCRARWHSLVRRGCLEERGITVLGADAYVQTQLTAVSGRQLRFLQVLPTVQQCLYSLLNVDHSGHLAQQAACLAQIALRHGGLGLRSAQLHARADALPAVHRRDPELATSAEQQLEVPGAPLVAVQATVADLIQCGFEASAARRMGLTAQCRR